MFGGQLEGARVAILRSDDHDLGAQPAYRVDFHRRRGVRDDDGRPQAELARHPGNRPRVIAARVRHHAAGPRVVNALQDRVEGATELERASRLQRLGLEPQWTAWLRRRVRDERRPHDAAGDTLGCRSDVLNGDEGLRRAGHDATRGIDGP